MTFSNYAGVIINDKRREKGNAERDTRDRSMRPLENLNELKMEVNDKLEALAKAIINGVQLYETTQGWVAVVWYKIIPK